VFHAASSRAQAAVDAANGLATLPAFATWGGVAAEAATEAIGKTRRDLDDHGREAQAVANAARNAADQIEHIKSELAALMVDAESLGMEIDPVTGQVLPSRSIRAPMEALLKAEQLQPRVTKIIAEANMVDVTLANVIHMADGTVPIASSQHEHGPEIQAALNNPVPEDTKAFGDLWQLTPKDPDAPDPVANPAGQSSNVSGALDQVAGDPVPAVADPATGKSGGPPTSLSGALDQVAGAPVPAKATPTVIPAKDVEAFKASARPLLASQGVPPEQIESRLSEVVARAQQEGINTFYRPPEAGRMQAPGFGEGFGDAWRNSEQSLKNLLGQGGPGAPGVVDSWKEVAKGVQQTVTNPVGTAVGQVQHALDSPSAAYYAGEKTFDLTAAAATAPFGAEGAAIRAGLPAELVTEGGAPLAVMRGWDPSGGMPASDFQSLFGTPEARIWPDDNDGFPPGYVPQPAHLPAGTIIDRFGSEFGRYLSPDGTVYGDRAITPETVGGEYNRYMVTGAPLPPGWRIVEGPVQPWLGQTPSPTATQCMIVGPEGARITVNDLVTKGILDRAGPPLGR